MRILLALLLLCLSSFGADLTLAWDDDQAGASYVVYERAADGKTWVKIGTAQTKTYVVKDVAKGAHTYIVTALVGGVESLPSNELLVPKEVTNLRAVLTMEVK